MNINRKGYEYDTKDRTIHFHWKLKYTIYLQYKTIKLSLEKNKQYVTIVT